MVYTVEELAGAMPDVSHLESCEPEYGKSRTLQPTCFAHGLSELAL